METSACRVVSWWCSEAMKAVVAFKKSARTLRTLPFHILPVCDASSCTSPEDQARAHIFAQRQSTVHQGATWWSKKAVEGVPAEHRQLLDALLRGADHGSGHTGQRHGCRRDLFFAFAHNRSPHTDSVAMLETRHTSHDTIRARGQGPPTGAARLPK